MDAQIKNSPTVTRMILKTIALLSLRDLKLPSLTNEPASDFNGVYGRKPTVKNINPTRVNRMEITIIGIFLRVIDNIQPKQNLLYPVV
jgi:hypothetical protein